MISFFTLLWWLMVGHFAVDYPLQGDTVAVQKSPIPGARNESLNAAVPWYYWMTAHALMHGGVVAFVTGKIWLGCAEALCHWYIDLLKCMKAYSIHVDQGLHLICKILWALIALKILDI